MSSLKIIWRDQNRWWKYAGVVYENTTDVVKFINLE